MIEVVGQSGPILLITVSTSPTGEQIAAAVNRIYPAHDFKHTLWDLRPCGLDAFTADHFAYVGLTSARRAKSRGADPRTGVLVNSRVEELTIAAFAGQAERLSPVRFWASTNRQALIDWLLTGVRPDDATIAAADGEDPKA
ncbi:MAG: hypothetical protein AAF684_00795 [Pseudomonadota bacterium]